MDGSFELAETRVLSELKGISSLPVSVVEKEGPMRSHQINEKKSSLFTNRVINLMPMWKSFLC